MSKTRSKKKILFLCMRILVVAAGIMWAAWWIIKERKWPELSRLFSQMSIPLFILVLLVFILSQAVVAFRWWLILRSQKIRINLWSAMMLHFVGLFYNNFLPSAVGGDLMRAWYVTHHTEKKFEAILSVFVDRVLGLLSMMILASVSWGIFLGGQGFSIQTKENHYFRQLFTVHKLWLSIFIILIAVIVSVLFVNKLSRTLVLSFLGRLRAKSAELIKKGYTAFILYCSSPITILSVLLITMVTQSILILFFVLLGRNLGVDAKVYYFFVFFPASWVISSLPVSIGGAVLVEGVLYYLFTKLAGVPAEPALAVVLCQRLVWMLAGIPGVIVHLAGAHLPKDFFIDCKEPVN